MMLWPRFKQVLELNLQSIRSANLKKMGYGAYPPPSDPWLLIGTTRLVATGHNCLSSSNCSPRVPVPTPLPRSVDLGAHFISKRYAEFTASIANLHRTLQAEDMSDDSVLHNLCVTVLCCLCRQPSAPR
jgi:hypothetical protein